MKIIWRMVRNITGTLSAVSIGVFPCDRSNAATLRHRGLLRPMRQKSNIEIGFR